MSIDNNQDKEILTSMIFNVLNTVIMSDDWFTNYNLEMRKDGSELDSSTGAEDATALKVKLTFGNMFFMNKEKSKIVLASAAYTTNQALGTDMSYDRLDAAGTYVGQLAKGYAFTAGLSYFMLSYGSNPNGRVDNSFTASTSLSHKLNDRLSGSLALSYNDNESNVDAYAYSKWTAMLTLSSNWHF
jgi:hypothetical protein